MLLVSSRSTLAHLSLNLGPWLHASQQVNRHLQQLHVHPKKGQSLGSVCSNFGSPSMKKMHAHKNHPIIQFEHSKKTQGIFCIFYAFLSERALNQAHAVWSSDTRKKKGKFLLVQPYKTESSAGILQSDWQEPWSVHPRQTNWSLPSSVCWSRLVPERFYWAQINCSLYPSLTISTPLLW